MSSQLVETCRQLVESRSVIAGTRRNFVVNPSELGFNIVLYRSNSYATRSNSLPCYAAVFGETLRTGLLSISTKKQVSPNLTLS